MTNPLPLVSVLISAFNAEAFIGEAIESVLSDDYEPIEVIVVDDGSEDRTASIATSFTSQGVHVISLKENKGIPSALNIGLASCTGKYIARLDADDKFITGRLRHQVGILEKEPAIGVLGGSAISLVNGIHGSQSLMVATNTNIGCLLLQGNQLKSSTVMIRHSVLTQNQIHYDNQYPNAQDYELWCRLSQVTQLANDSKPVAIYRYHSSQETSRHFRRQLALSLKVQKRALKNAYRLRSCSITKIALGYVFLFRHYLLLVRVAVTNDRISVPRKLRWRNINQ